MNEDVEQGKTTIGKMHDFDAAENVFVVLAHDQSLRDKLTFFPEKANDWREKGIKQQTRWAWASALENSLASQKLVP
jgi:hypothetical protein